MVVTFQKFQIQVFNPKKGLYVKAIFSATNFAVFCPPYFSFWSDLVRPLNLLGSMSDMNNVYTVTVQCILCCILCRDFNELNHIFRSERLIVY